jgi:hypothetical protein
MIIGAAIGVAADGQPSALAGVDEFASALPEERV